LSPTGRNLGNAFCVFTFFEITLQKRNKLIYCLLNLKKRKKRILELCHTPIPIKISGFSPWSRSMNLGSVESELPKLTNRVIIFEEFEHVVTIPQRYGQTTCCGNTALCVASRVKTQDKKK